MLQRQCAIGRIMISSSQTGTIEALQLYVSLFMWRLRVAAVERYAVQRGIIRRSGKRIALK